MPVSFQFKDKETNEPVSLNRIDELVCKYWNYPVDEKRFNWNYDSLASVGIAVCWSTSLATIEGVNEYFATSEMDFSEKFRDFCRKFLAEDYTFSAWR